MNHAEAECNDSLSLHVAGVTWDTYIALPVCVAIKLGRLNRRGGENLYCETSASVRRRKKGGPYHQMD